MLFLYPILLGTKVLVPASSLAAPRKRAALDQRDTFEALESKSQPYRLIQWDFKHLSDNLAAWTLPVVDA